jgi:hypothetical protein
MKNKMNKDTNINQELLNAAKCAVLDLQGALEVEKAQDPFVFLDVNGVKQTIKELKAAIAKAAMAN